LLYSLGLLRKKKLLTNLDVLLLCHKDNLDVLKSDSEA